MPVYLEYERGKVVVGLLPDEETLVRASIKGNIAALHFDGQVLIDLLTAQRELENRERRA